jgi:hypothetical protein
MPTLDRVQAQIDLLSVGMPIADDDLVANPLAPNPAERHSVTADYAETTDERDQRHSAEQARWLAEEERRAIKRELSECSCDLGGHPTQMMRDLGDKLRALDER